jgi:hypothetical protein
MRAPSCDDASPYVRYIKDMPWAREDLEKRARHRRSWVVRVHRLDNQPRDDLSGQTTAEERLAMMWPLAVEAWSLSGRQLAEYSRAETPVRILTDASGEGNAGS